MDFALRTTAVDTVTILEVDGEIDVATAPRVRDRLVDLVNEGSVRIVVDLSRVTFIDSTGLGVLVGGLKRVRAQDGAFRIVCDRPNILRIFVITGLTDVFAIHDSISSAVASITPGSAGDGGPADDEAR